MPIEWMTATSFVAHMTTPAAPWLVQAPPHAALLRSGTYQVGVECLPLLRGCAHATSQGSAGFSLRVTQQSPWCTNDSGCAHLSITPATAYPGQVVLVRGFAPLVSVIGSNQPFVFQLQVLPGPGRGPEVSFVVPNSKGTVVHLGRAALEVTSAPSLASIGSTVPLSETFSGLGPIGADPIAPSTIAWCATGAVDVSSASGLTTVPTAAVPGELTRLGFTPIPDGTAASTCADVAPLPQGLPEDAVAAAFPVVALNRSPNISEMALFTTDGGRVWKQVPTPAGANSGGFGGFRYVGGKLEAVFARGAGSGGAGSGGAGSAASGLPPTEVLAPGSTVWHTSHLQCPSRSRLGGPCATFGAYHPGNCAMNGSSQPILYSRSGGLAWREPGWPAEVTGCAQAELVATAGAGELLVSSGSVYTIRRSTDAGAIWSDVSIPPIPGLAAGQPLMTAQIIVLPDGAMLLTGARAVDTSGAGASEGGGSGAQRWELLTEGASAWCSPMGVSAASERSSGYSQVALLAGALWWQASAGATPEHVPAAALRC